MGKEYTIIVLSSCHKTHKENSDEEIYTIGTVAYNGIVAFGTKQHFLSAGGENA